MKKNVGNGIKIIRPCIISRWFNQFDLVCLGLHYHAQLAHQEQTGISGQKLGQLSDE